MKPARLRNAVLLLCLACLPASATLAQDQCFLTSEDAFSGYLDQIAVGLGTRIDYRYSEGMGGGMRLTDDIIPAHKPFVRGAAGIRKDDVLFVVQFDRDGTVTDVDIRRRLEHAQYELLASMFGDCLDPYREQLAAFDTYITQHVQFQIAQEKARRAEFEQDEEE